MKISIVTLLIAILLGFLGVYLQGPLPGDVEFTFFLQVLLNQFNKFAVYLTLLGAWPIFLIPLTFTLLLGFLWEGQRGLLFIIATYSAVKILDWILRSLFFSPRPQEELVIVFGPNTSTGWPSVLGMNLGVLLMSLLFLSKRKSDNQSFHSKVFNSQGLETNIVESRLIGSKTIQPKTLKFKTLKSKTQKWIFKLKKPFPVLSILILTAAGLARILLGGHWLSQMLSTYLLVYSVVSLIYLKAYNR